MWKKTRKALQVSLFERKKNGTVLDWSFKILLLSLVDELDKHSLKKRIEKKLNWTGKLKKSWIVNKWISYKVKQMKFYGQKVRLLGIWSDK